jgi:TRAP-type mannitol/chloroaromatic compound transport system permease large subunit
LRFVEGFAAPGLSYAVIFVGAILGAITGTVAASVIAMGVISMMPMLKYGYSTRHTMGVIAASGTITQLIPPSLVLIVLQLPTCPWRIRNYAAIGIWKRPRQWCRQV